LISINEITNIICFGNQPISNSISA